MMWFAIQHTVNLVVWCFRREPEHVYPKHIAQPLNFVCRRLSALLNLLVVRHEPTTEPSGSQVNSFTV